MRSIFAAVISLLAAPIVLLPLASALDIATQAPRVIEYSRMNRSWLTRS